MNDENSQASQSQGDDANPPPQNDGDDSKTPSSQGDDGKQSKVTSPLQSDDELSEDQFITGGDDHSFITSVPVPAHPNTQFDEKKFLELLAKSISLTKTEKQRIIGSIPKLSQYQIDELMRIFEEEQKKFAELSKKHEDELKKIEEKHKNDWNDVELQAKQDAKKKKDDDEAAKLRKQMGLE